MIKAVLIDDEKNNIEYLRNLLQEYCPQVVVDGSAENLNTAYDLINQMDPDLVFLDIEMPFGNGFDLLEKLMPVKFEVIFVTAFDQYAIRAFKFSALDYLLKPVHIESLKKAVTKAEKKIGNKTVNTQIRLLLENFKSTQSGVKKIALPIADGLHFEETDAIIYLKATGSNTSVFINNGNQLLVIKSLKEFEEILPSTVFCRVHHSYIVNLNYIKKYFKGRGGYLELTNGSHVEVSSRKKDEFLEKFRV